MAVARVLDFSVCQFISGIPLWLVDVTDTLQMAFGTSMFLLIVNRFVRDSLQTYQVTKEFELSRYMNLLARDSVLYFLAYV